MCVITALAGCGGKSSDQTKPSRFDAPREPVNLGGEGDVFQPNRVLEIAVSMDAEEFEALKAEGRSLASTARECLTDYEYTEYTASVTIDGERMEEVVVRKKGYMGSLSPSRPSLKLDFNKKWDGRTYQSQTGLTLNNNRQDPSNARQCMAFDIFRKAGVAAPRCNYARVSVNGQLLGIFTNVEPIKKPFLEAAFGDDEGNLYEAQTADFGQWLSRRFEKKTNEKANDRSDLQAVSDALALPDDQLMNVLPQLVNIDQFIRFWAIETLLGAWDSASGNANNFHIYRNPADGLFHFIPWGADTAFRGEHPLKPGTGVLYRNFSLAKRLFDIPDYRARYEAELNQLLAAQWKEEELLQSLENIRQLTGTSEPAVSSLKSFITGLSSGSTARPSRRVAIEQALADVHSAAAFPIENVAPDCSEPFTTALTGSVSASGGVDQGAFSFMRPDGRKVNASLTFAAFEVDSLLHSVDTETSPEVVSLLMIGVDAAEGFKPYVLQVFIEASDYVPGTHQLHGFATTALLFEVDMSLPGQVRTLALASGGSFTLTRVGTGAKAGDVELSFNASLEYGPDAL
ncbi:CotH kinase family protein [Allohahella sp. A8]|uniref:CotH kinase family protein n=1 Tax=Allohahella sp. A8 TaxID=3141461 RepID=UPI003A7FFBCC